MKNSTDYLKHHIDNMLIEWKISKERNYLKQAVDRKQTDKLPEYIITIGNK